MFSDYFVRIARNSRNFVDNRPEKCGVCVRKARKSRKMLQLVGEKIGNHRASYGVEQGRLVPIMRGVLVEAGDDAEPSFSITLSASRGICIPGLTCQVTAPKNSRQQSMDASSCRESAASARGCVHYRQSFRDRGAG